MNEFGLKSVMFYIRIFSLIKTWFLTESMAMNEFDVFQILKR